MDTSYMNSGSRCSTESFEAFQTAETVLIITVCEFNSNMDVKNKVNLTAKNVFKLLTY